jgi:ZIP family zinc transporter
MDLIFKVFVWALLPTAAMVVGGLAALLRAPGSAARSIILHFAAGVVFSVVSVELMPDIIKRHAPIEIIIGFSAGIATMLGLRVLSRKAEEVEKAEQQLQSIRLPSGMLFGIAVDIAVDGLLLGIGFASGGSIGTMLTLALSVELLALGLATSSSLLNQGLSKEKTCALIVALSSLFIITSILGITILRQLSGNNLEIVLSFGLAALLFLVTEELLVEAHEEKETPIHTASFFLGFLVLLILDIVGK